jgi:hypothetical protein
MLPHSCGYDLANRGYAFANPNRRLTAVRTS